MILAAFSICLITSVILTPIVRKLAIKFGATDRPNQRKVHKNVMPRLGGLAIYISFIIGFFIMNPESQYTWPIMIGASIIVLVGMLDDLMEIKARWKVIGQIAAAAVVMGGGVYVDSINLPFDGTLHLGLMGIPFTLLWIVGITNAINLIDGLDGLAAGIASIFLLTVTIIAIMDGNTFIVILASLLLASTIGFLFYNFHPAVIFMGDTGALFQGYMSAVISLLGFKTITFFSLIIPIVILLVPISDTLFAIIRRIVNKKPLSVADKSHLHHCLLDLGHSHKKAVLIMYGISAFFAVAAILLTQSTLWTGLIILAAVLLVVELIVEVVGLMNRRYKPVLNLIYRFRYGKKSDQMN